MTEPNPAYREAVALLRTVSKSAPDRPVCSVLLRVIAVNRAAATTDVLKNPLRTKSDRQKAAISAAEAIRAAAAAKAAGE